MKVKSILVGLASLVIVTVFGSAVALTSISLVDAAPAPKVAICHHTSSATNPIVVIEVSENAVPDHLAHGDGFFAGTSTTGEILCVDDRPVPNP